MRTSSAALALALVTPTSLVGCSDSVEFTTPGRAPPSGGDLVIEVDGMARGFGPASLAKDAQGRPLLSASIGTQSSASVVLPGTASSVTCKDLPKAIVLTTSSPLEHQNSTYNEVTWTATECAITVSRIDATATKGAEGSFSGTLVRDQDTVGGKEIVGPKTLSVKATFIVSAP